MLQKKLDRMVEKSFIYGTKTVRIKFCKIIDDEVILSTDKGIIHLRAEQVAEIDKLFLETDDSGEINGSALAIKTDSAWSGLKDTIYSLINEVKNDPAAIEKANSINASVKTLIDMMKVEIEVERLMRSK